MIFGYNTDVQAPSGVYHVQTEDRGEKNPVIDSVIYVKGQILDKRRTKYVPGEVTPEQLKEMVKNQHRELVDSIKAGTFVPGAGGASGESAAHPAPTVELVNPDSLEDNGRLLFHLRAPSGARVEASLEINGGEAETASTTADKSGDAELSFAMPESSDAAVVFRAVIEGSTKMLKFVVRQQ